MASTQNHFRITRWRRIPEERRALLREILTDKACSEVFSDKYFDGIAKRLERIVAAKKKMAVVLLAIALVLIAGFLHKDVSISLFGLNIGSELVRDTLFFVYLTISLMISTLTYSSHFLADILKSRFKKLDNEQCDLYMAQYERDIVSIDGIYAGQNKHNTLVPTNIAFYAVLVILSTIAIGLTVCSLTVLFINVAVIVITTYRLIEEPISPAFISYSIAAYGIFTTAVEIGFMFLYYVPLPFEDVWPLIRLRRLDEIYPNRPSDNARRVRAEMASSSAKRR
jgi:hypothetical protein